MLDEWPTWGELLRAARESRDLSRPRLARQLRIDDPQNFRRWEVLNVIPENRQLRAKLGRYVGIDPYRARASGKRDEPRVATVNAQRGHAVPLAEIEEHSAAGEPHLRDPNRPRKRGPGHA